MSETKSLRVELEGEALTKYKHVKATYSLGSDTDTIRLCISLVDQFITNGAITTHLPKGKE
jgi:hypothetical protein